MLPFSTVELQVSLSFLCKRDEIGLQGGCAADLGPLDLVIGLEDLDKTVPSFLMNDLLFPLLMSGER